MRCDAMLCYAMPMPMLCYAVLMLCFLEVDIDYVSAEAIISMKNLLRKFPDFHGRIIHGIGAFLKSVDEPDARVALLWMVGEYGNQIPESPFSAAPQTERASLAGRASARRPPERLPHTAQRPPERPPHMAGTSSSR